METNEIASYSSSSNNSASPSSSRDKESSSIIWNVFKVGLDGQTVICDLPDFEQVKNQQHHPTRLKFSENTSNFWHHLQSWHPKVYGELKSEDASSLPLELLAARVKANAAERARYGRSQNKMEQWITVVSRSKSKCSKELRLLLWMVRSGVPFNAIDNQEWKKFLVSCGVNLRGASFLRQTILPAVHGHIINHIRAPLQKIEAVAVVMDGWEVFGRRKIGVVVRHISPEWKIQTDVVGLIEVNSKHTAQTIASYVDARLKALLGDNTLIAASVSDNGGNYVNASKRITNGEAWPCFCHTLQLVIHDVFEDKSREYSRIWFRVQEIVNAVRSSTELRGQLQQTQMVLDFDQELALISDNATRWNSQLRLAERFLQLKQPLQMMFEKVQQLESFLSSHEVNLLQQLCDVLRELKIISDEMESDKVTLSLVPQHVFGLLNTHLQSKPVEHPVVVNFKDALRLGVMKRFGHILKSVTLSGVAAALDPRTGHLEFLEKQLRDDIWKQVEKEACDLLLHNNESSKDSTNNPPMFQLTANTITALVQNVREGFENPKHHAALQLVDPLQWWSQQTMLSALAPVVRMLLCIPASNAAAERSFSSAGFLSEDRERLNSNTLEELAVIRHYVLQHQDEQEQENLISQMLKTIEDNQ
ncbi:MAG: hAT transposon family protein [Rhabdochlamydiaceae bacterium]